MSSSRCASELKNSINSQPSSILNNDNQLIDLATAKQSPIQDTKVNIHILTDIESIQKCAETEKKIKRQRVKIKEEKQHSKEKVKSNPQVQNLRKIYTINILFITREYGIWEEKKNYEFYKTTSKLFSKACKKLLSPNNQRVNCSLMEQVSDDACEAVQSVNSYIYFNQQLHPQLKLDSQQARYTSPIRIVKLKIDNTYQYIMPPVMFESFMEYMIESSIGQAKIRELKEQFKNFK